jgi:exosome complex RNA-binding protein Csl4
MLKVSCLTVSDVMVYHLRSAQDFVKVGDIVEAQILTLDRDDRKCH